MAYDLIERECAFCGKIFIPAPYHSYKYCDKLLCSYTCRLRYEEQRAEENAQRKAQKQKAGKSTTDKIKRKRGQI